VNISTPVLLFLAFCKQRGVAVASVKLLSRSNKKYMPGDYFVDFNFRALAGQKSALLSISSNWRSETLML
jgi:hypothetical protein